MLNRSRGVCLLGVILNLSITTNNAERELFRRICGCGGARLPVAAPLLMGGGDAAWWCCCL